MIGGIQCVHAVDPPGQITAVLEIRLVRLYACEECDKICFLLLHKSPEMRELMADGEGDIVRRDVSVIVCLNGERGEDSCQVKAGENLRKENLFRHGIAA